MFLNVAFSQVMMASGITDRLFNLLFFDSGIFLRIVNSIPEGSSPVFKIRDRVDYREDGDAHLSHVPGIAYSWIDENNNLCNYSESTQRPIERFFGIIQPAMRRARNLKRMLEIHYKLS